MLPSGDGLTVRPVTQVEAPASVAAIGDTRGDLYQRALQRILGQQLQGEVMSRFTDGSFLVKVGETAARMMLPAGTRVGDNLQMRLVSLEPRPSFEIGGDTNQAAVVALSRGPADEAEVRLPIISVTDDEQQAKRQDSESSQEQHTPSNANQLAQQSGGAILGAGNRLAQKFAQIGAMYRPEFEIHSEASDDAATVPTIGKDGALIAQIEPSKLSQSNAHSATSFSSAGKLINQILLAAQRDGAPAALQGKEAIVQEPANAPQQVAVALRDTLNTSGLFYESHVAEWADGKRSLSDLMREPQMQAHDTPKEIRHDQNRVEFAQLVNLQLNTLEQQKTRWHGEIWPGQNMDWEVSKVQDEAPGKHSQSGQQSWQSVVRFELPELGSVQASIHLIGERVHIQVQTEDDSTASLLRAHADTLADALGAAGSPLDSLLVKRHD